MLDGVRYIRKQTEGPKKIFLVLEKMFSLVFLINLHSQARKHVYKLICYIAQINEANSKRFGSALFFKQFLDKIPPQIQLFVEY